MNLNIDDILEFFEDDFNENNALGLLVDHLTENTIIHLGNINNSQRIKNKNYYEQIIINYDLDDFHRHFRMTRVTFQVLLNTVGSTLPKKTKIPLDKKLLFSIWFLAKQETFLSTGDRFNFSPSTAHTVFFEICQTIENLRQQFITWPNNQKRQQISEEFEAKCGISGIVGAIDGTHIEIKAPINNAVDFYNRNNYHSVILQAICDNKMIFTDIYVGCPGRMHDSRVFNLSPIFDALSNNHILPDHQHLLGDSAYSLCPYF